MNYPYYIVTWHEGRLPCPPQYRGTVIQKQFDNGQIGGKRMLEEKTDDPQVAYATWSRDRFKRRIYVVERQGGQRRVMRSTELQHIMRGGE